MNPRIAKFRNFILAAIFVGASNLAFAGAKSEQVIYAFCPEGLQGCYDGAYPTAALIADKAGNFYGSTSSGGAYSAGTIFELSPPAQGQAEWAETILYNFCSQANCSDGSTPFAPLTMDKNGNLYGTTIGGGTTACDCGTVFAITPGGVQIVLHSFEGGSDGLQPVAGVIDIGGTLYGTTEGGGGSNCGNGGGCGTVFSVNSTTGAEKVLYSFCSLSGCADGSFPQAGLIEIGGTLYGTTSENSNGTGCCGTVFSIDPNTGAETVLHSFGRSGDGWYPVAGLVADAQGTLYGTTESGGDCGLGYYGCGTIFKVDPDGTESVLYNFCSNHNGYACPSGGYPEAPLLLDKKGNLYGTAATGGDDCWYDVTCGTAFRLTPGGKYTVLHAFGEGTGDGNEPEAALIDVKGTLYGTTNGGGSGLGTVFALRK